MSEVSEKSLVSEFRISSEEFLAIESRFKEVKEVITWPSEESLRAENQSKMADQILEAFPHLRLLEGRHIASVTDGRVFYLVVCNCSQRPERLPGSFPKFALPAEFFSLTVYGSFFPQFNPSIRSEKPSIPKSLPDWVSLDVLESIDDDGSPISCFERCYFSHFLPILHVQTIDGEVRQEILSDPQQIELTIASFPYSRGRNRSVMPSDCRPMVVFNCNSEIQGVELPKSKQNQELITARNFKFVTYFMRQTTSPPAHSSRMYRYCHWITEKSIVCSERELVC